MSGGRIFEQAQAEVLLDAIDELVLRPEGLAAVLQENLQKLQRQHLQTQGHDGALLGSKQNVIGL